MATEISFATAKQTKKGKLQNKEPREYDPIVYCTIKSAWPLSNEKLTKFETLLIGKLCSRKREHIGKSILSDD